MQQDGQKIEIPQKPNQAITLSIGGNRRSLHCAPPDFLNLVGSASFMRLSRKAAHAAMSTAAPREIRVRSVEKHFQEGSAELQIPRLPPDFLLSPMGSAKLMRLSLMKAANEVIFGAA
jgi:hypothetical protein